MYRGDTLRLSVFLVLFGSVTLFNILMCFPLLRGETGSGSRAESVPETPCTAVMVLFYILFPLEAVCLIYGFFIEVRWPQVTKHRIRTSSLKPGSCVRIVHLSDLHVETIGSHEKKLLKKTGECSPDMILITGDYANYRSGYETAALLLRKLSDIAPCYLVTGNVDCNFAEETRKLKDEFAFIESGVTPVAAGAGTVFLAGCDDSEPGVISEAVQQLEHAESGFRILLYHKPDLADDPSVSAFDLYLSGHTHGGQVRIPGFGAVITMSELGKRYEMGEYDLGRTRLYVNRGYGFEGGSRAVPKVRFLCRPEIALFIIEGTYT